jgi:hypothetical protein
MRKIIILAAAMALLPIAAGAQSAGSTNTDTSRLGQPSNPDTSASGNKNSSSSQNTPSTGETAGRNNPSVDRAPDTAQSRGTSSPQSQ